MKEIDKTIKVISKAANQMQSGWFLRLLTLAFLKKSKENYQIKSFSGNSKIR